MRNVHHLNQSICSRRHVCIIILLAFFLRSYNYGMKPKVEEGNCESREHFSYFLIDRKLAIMAKQAGEASLRDYWIVRLRFQFVMLFFYVLFFLGVFIIQKISIFTEKLRFVFTAEWSSKLDSIPKAISNFHLMAYQFRFQFRSR